MNNNNSRNLIYDNSGLVFLLLNILGHDVIHDYGGRSNPDRWGKNFDIVTQFNGTFTFNSNVGGGIATTSTKVLPYRTSQSPIKPYKFHTMGPTSSSFSSQRPRTTLLLREEEQEEEEEEQQGQEEEEQFYKFLNELKNSCIFSIFYYKIYKNFNKIWSLEDFFIGAFGFLIEPFSNNSRNEMIDEIFINICHSFLDYLYKKNIKILEPDFKLNFDDYYNLLDSYLSTNLLEQRILLCLSQGFTSFYTLTNSSSIETQPREARIKLYEKIPASMPTSVSQKRKRDDMYGGAKAKNESVDENSIKELLGELDNYKNTYLNNEKLGKLGRIYREFKDNDGVISQNDKEEYDNTRKSMLDELKNILKGKKQEYLSGQVDNASSNDRNVSSFIPILKIGRTGINSPEEFMTKGAKNFFDEFVYDKYQRQIDNIEKERLQLLDNKINEALDKAKQLNGYLSSSEIQIRKNFSRIVARSALYLNGICNENGDLQGSYNTLINTSNLTKTDYFLAKEIQILLNQSGWVQIRGISDLDDYLYNLTKNYFKKNMKASINDGSRIYCSKNTKNSKYIVNNAAYLNGKTIQNSVFCPNSSILDGMSQCSPNTSQGQLEIGNMNFTIKSNTNKGFYNGLATILKDNPKLETKKVKFVSYDINVQTINGTQISPTNVYSELGMTNPFFKMNRLSSSSPLEAYHVLKVTLTLFIKKIEILYNNSRTEYDEIIRTGIILADEDEDKQESSFKKQKTEVSKENPEFFKNFFNLQLNESHREDPNFFFNILANIYYKGTGDLYQEINSVSKFGGYLNDKNYYADDNVIPWNFKENNGDLLRMFLAKDQPSACRFAFLLMFGDPNTINNYAFGGYSGGKTKELIVSRRYYNEIVKSKNPNSVVAKNIVCNNGTSISKRGGGTRGLKKITTNKTRKIRTRK